MRVQIFTPQGGVDRRGSKMSEFEMVPYTNKVNGLSDPIIRGWGSFVHLSTLLHDNYSVLNLDTNEKVDLPHWRDMYK